MLGRHGLSGRIARQQSAAFAKSSRSMSSFRPQIARLPLRPGKILSGTSTWRTSVPSISGAGAIRFNSTSSPPTIAAVPDSPASADSAAFTTPEVDLSNIDISAIPERIGFMKELGLDYGWGTSSIIQFAVEHFHIWGGLPWVGSIIATGALVRLAMLPLFVRAADHGTKAANVRPLAAPLRTEMMRASQAGNTAEAMRLRVELVKINKDAGISNWAMFGPMLIQIPLGIGCYRVINGMASLPVPSLGLEHFAWITDLTVADPFYILPAMTAVFTFLTIKRGGEFGNVDPNMGGVQKVVQFIMPAIGFLFTMGWPAALQLYFVSTSLLGLVQSLFINNVAIRRMTGIAIPNKYLPEPPTATQTQTSEQSRQLRTLAEAAAHFDGEAHKQSRAQETQMSFIDRALKSAKESKDKIVRETTEKVNELSGQGPKTNRDGSPAQPARLSAKDRKLAEDYEKRRKEEEEWRREEQNHARREAHLKSMERQREQARTAWKRTNMNKDKQR